MKYEVNILFSTIFLSIIMPSEAPHPNLPPSSEFQDQ